MRSAFGFKTPEDSPGFLLWQTSVTWQRKIKQALEPSGLTHPQFVLMALLLWFEEQQEPPTQVKLANLSRLDKMTVSQSLKGLSKQGWIDRVEHQEDTRAKSVSLTEAGRATILAFVPVVEGVDAEFFSGLAGDEVKMLNELLRKLNLFDH
jgi:DNA-binding MarR family transcriptional regulator